MRLGRLPDFPFRDSVHDRLAERRRDETFLEAAWADSASRVLVSRGGELSVDDDEATLRLVAPADAPLGDRLLLGKIDEVVHFLVLTDPASPSSSLTETGSFIDLRRLASHLNPTYGSLAVHATSLAGWHGRHPICAVCGTRSDIVEAGAARRCPSCSTMHFPRTDPAVIMLVVDVNDRCLLGHNSARPSGWFSTLAGFVEPGESPEHAVAREVMEEAGIEVDDVTYAGSQPWPFPSSLMLGFFAEARSTAITVDGDEITEARWFTREELTAGVLAGELVVPTTVSIAGALLTHWYGADLPPNRPG